MKEIIRFFLNHLLGHITELPNSPEMLCEYIFFCVLLQVGGDCTEDMKWSPLHPKDAKKKCANTSSLA